MGGKSRHGTNMGADGSWLVDMIQFCILNSQGVRQVPASAATSVAAVRRVRHAMNAARVHDVAFCGKGADSSGELVPTISSWGDSEALPAAEPSLNHQ